ncbi:MAG: hypothetical protein NZV14_03415 [Bryobacteraceae bacterium]|nr:hypothetical protein [Bryobacteraceae bacterium]MDW8377185.1 hypothetical protein [Bryobacterales bacterium]
MKRLLGCLVLWVAVQVSAAGTDITGKWKFEVQLDAGSGSPTFIFEQNGEKLSGKYQGQFGEETLSGTVKGNTVKFTFRLSQGGESVEVTYEGAMQEDGTMKGKATYGSFASGTWTAKRVE